MSADLLLQLVLPALFFGPTELQPADAKLFCCFRRSHSKHQRLNLVQRKTFDSQACKSKREGEQASAASMTAIITMMIIIRIITIIIRITKTLSSS